MSPTASLSGLGIFAVISAKIQSRVWLSSSSPQSSAISSWQTSKSAYGVSLSGSHSGGFFHASDHKTYPASPLGPRDARNTVTS
jgi:hypothetical protein